MYIRYGIMVMQENAENTSTILVLFSPSSPSFLTLVYAKPANIPLMAPISAGIKLKLLNEGLITKRAPQNATITQRTSFLSGFSCIRKIEKMMAQYQNISI